MKPNKPIEELNHQELNESCKHYEDLILSTQSILDNLNNSPEGWMKVVNYILSDIVSKNRTDSFLKELTLAALSNFKLTHEIIMEELLRRK